MEKVVSFLKELEKPGRVIDLSSILNETALDTLGEDQGVRIFNEAETYKLDSSDGFDRPENIILNAAPALKKGIALILKKKFVDGISFGQMADQLRLSGLDISRETLCTIAMKAGQSLKEIVDLMHWDALGSPVMFYDENNVDVLREKMYPLGRSFICVVIGYFKEKPIYRFIHHTGKVGSVADEMLGDFHGFLQTDAYSSYAHMAPWGDIVIVGCFANILRRFVQAYETAYNKNIAQEAINIISRIYKTEEELREKWTRKEIDNEAFVSARKKQLHPIFTEFHSWLMENAPKISLQCTTGYAIDYAKKTFEKSIRFVEHPLLHPDTSIVAQAIKPFLINDPYWHFSDSPHEAQTSADLHSLMVTAKVNGHDPWFYLSWLLENLPHKNTTDDKRSMLPYRILPGSIH